MTDTRVPGLAAALTETDLVTLRQIIADALDYRREHQDGECADCDRGDCPVTRDDAARVRAYREFAGQLGLGDAG